MVSTLYKAGAKSLFFSGWCTKLLVLCCLIYIFSTVNSVETHHHHEKFKETGEENQQKEFLDTTEEYSLNTSAGCEIHV